MKIHCYYYIHMPIKDTHYGYTLNQINHCLTASNRKAAYDYRLETHQMF